MQPGMTSNPQASIGGRMVQELGTAQGGRGRTLWRGGARKRIQPSPLHVPAGVIDDRGKFIYITPEELAAVATFIRQRGRVSIAELAQASNSLISWGQETPTQAPA